MLSKLILSLFFSIFLIYTLSFTFCNVVKESVAFVSKHNNLSYRIINLGQNSDNKHYSIRLYFILF